MASDLRKCVALHPSGMNPGHWQNYNVQRGFVQGTGTRWVRLWADWTILQPTQSSTIGSDPSWLNLDAQIKQANADGVYVVLTAYKTPLWANSGTRGSMTPPVPDSDPYAQYYVPDFTDLWMPGTQTRTPWAAFIDHMVLRYNLNNPGNQGWVAILEIMNEPNLQMRPQVHTGSGALISQIAANMMKTSWLVKAQHGIQDNWPILAGPATADTRTTKDTETSYDTFTNRVLNALGGWQGGPYFGWSHHNHLDIEYDAAGTDNSARNVRAALVNRWWGWGSPSDPSQPRLFLTEGGARLNRVSDRYFAGGGSPDQLRAKQNQLLQSNHARMISNSGEGTGVSMLTHYLFTSDYHYDTGLREPYTYDSQASIR